MQTTRTVAHIEAATTAQVGPMMVKRALPVRHIQQVDPFIFIDHMQPFEIEKGKDLGRIDPHPHAGFEVVTYMLEGKGFHRDSLGNEQVAGPGDINWMTSGKGIVHSEGAAAELVAEGGRMSLMQVWINLPADKKSLDPSFRYFEHTTLPEVADDNSLVKVLIGTYKNATSPVPVHTPMYYYHIKLKAGAVFTYDVQPEYTAGIYVMDGSLKVLNSAADKGAIVVMNNDGDQVAVKAVTDAEFMVFGGQPINEEMVSYGPFVMNNVEQVREAIHRYETGAMGVLEY